VPAQVDITDPRIITALNHPLRARILATLDDQVASPKELAQVLGAPLGTVSYHVKILAELGLIRLVKETPRRGAVEHHYQSKPRRPRTTASWDQLPKTAKRAAAEGAARVLGPALEGAAARGGFDRAGACLGHLALDLDEAGWADAVREVERLNKRLQQIGQESRKRLRAANDRDPLASHVATALFEAR
jgi:DNA-binding transcriptional ArsR family regulator